MPHKLTGSKEFCFSEGERTKGRANQAGIYIFSGSGNLYEIVQRCTRNSGILPDTFLHFCRDLVRLTLNFVGFCAALGKCAQGCTERHNSQKSLIPRTLRILVDKFYSPVDGLRYSCLEMRSNPLPHSLRQSSKLSDTTQREPVPIGCNRACSKCRFPCGNADCENRQCP